MQSVLTDDRAAGTVANLGFWVQRDVPTDEAEAELTIAIRGIPTLRHFDPELLTYWKTDEGGRGRPGHILYDSAMPIERPFGWGTIEIVDRLGESNAFLGFGGRLRGWRAEDGTVVAHFTSPAPILRRGGHSQRYETIAAEIGAFFGRLLVRIDFQPGAEQTINASAPEVLYALFLQHDAIRLADDRVRRLYPQDARFVTGESARVRRMHPDACSRADELRRILSFT
jgi:hypothetical protein